MKAFAPVLLVLILTACSSRVPDDMCIRICDTGPDGSYQTGACALVATRFKSMKDFKRVVQLAYNEQVGDTATEVRLVHCSKGHLVTGILSKGVSQNEISKAQNGSIWEKIGLMIRTPYAIQSRADLEHIYLLARRKPRLFGEADKAFFDLAETMVANINTPDLAFRSEADTTEKGYLNSFNHLTAQAFITSIFSEKMADFVADVHERKNMPELISGKFKPEQMTDPNNNPIDNYVDIVNNEWGQELGKQLKAKYDIHRETTWTPHLLSAYLNDLQSYYGWSLQIGFQPFRPGDEVVQKFAHKINRVMNDRF